MRHRHLITIKQTARKLGALIAPRDHAAKDNCSKDVDIPMWAWPASLALAGFFLFGPQILDWLLTMVV